jgi:hypothetical protein
VKLVYFKVKHEKKTRCEPINKAKADKYDGVYKDSKRTKVLRKSTRDPRRAAPDVALTI